MAKKHQPANRAAAASAHRKRGPFLDLYRFTQRVMHIKHEPFTFEGRPYLKQIYLSQARRKVLRASRQVEKSTLLANEIFYHALRHPGIRILFCSPRHDQAAQFSRSRLQPLVEQSFILRRRLWSRERAMPVQNIRFDNGSELYVRAAYRSADAARGISADALYIDEYQDLAPGALHILSETLSHSKVRLLTLAGTPKWIDNPLETAFQQSTAHEWHVSCENCRQETILGERTLGPGFLQCPQCQQPLDPTRGHWLARNPQSDWGDGYTISHTMVPWLKVPDILERQQHYDRVSFLNEVLGQPATLGDHIVTREEMERCCDDRPAARSLEDVPAPFRRQLVMGLDWGGGSQSGTVAVLGYSQGPSFHIVRLDRWRPHEDPNQILDEVLGLCRRFRVSTVAADGSGNGSVYNRMLYKKLLQDGQAPKIWGLVYGFDSQPPKLDGVLTQWLIGRTATIGGLFTRIKLGLIRFPRVAESGSFLDEFTCEIAEYNEEMRTVQYTKPQDRRDDALHATNYGESVAMRLHAAAQR